MSEIVAKSVTPWIEHAQIIRDSITGAVTTLCGFYPRWCHHDRLMLPPKSSTHTSPASQGAIDLVIATIYNRRYNFRPNGKLQNWQWEFNETRSLPTFISRNALFRYLTIKKKKFHKILLSKRFNKSNNLIYTMSNCIYYLFQWRFNGIFPCHNQVKTLPPTLLYSSTRHQKKKEKEESFHETIQFCFDNVTLLARCQFTNA